MKRFFLISLVILLSYGEVWAGPARPVLDNTMSYSQVVRLWGAPKEKQAFAAKREDIWVYDDSKVIFSNGKVSAWIILSGEGTPTMVSAAALNENKVSRDEEVVESNEEEDTQVEEILRDIMNDSSEDDKA